MQTVKDIDTHFLHNVFNDFKHILVQEFHKNDTLQYNLTAKNLERKTRQDK